MKSIIFLLLTIFVFNIPQDRYRPTAALCLAGGIIKSARLSTPIEAKYKRKDCPVCKGKGWYLSGDGLAKVDCGYCIADTGEASSTPVAPIPVKPPVSAKPKAKYPIRNYRQ